MWKIRHHSCLKLSKLFPSGRSIKYAIKLNKLLQSIRRIFGHTFLNLPKLVNISKWHGHTSQIPVATASRKNSAAAGKEN